MLDLAYENSTKLEAGLLAALVSTKDSSVVTKVVQNSVAMLGGSVWGDSSLEGVLVLFVTHLTPCSFELVNAGAKSDLAIHRALKWGGGYFRAINIMKNLIDKIRN